MKNILIILLVLFSTNVLASSKCSLKHTMIPYCYHKRSLPIINISLLYYGDYFAKEDLLRIAPILKERFKLATNGQLELNILDHKVIDFRHKMPADYKFGNIMDPKRLQRIWYYDNVGTKIMQEVYEEYKKVTDDLILDKIDALITITGAQFDGLGFASGRVSVTEYPREIAWGLPDGGRVEYVNDYQIVDELIHELGHNLFLGHTSTQCQKQGMSYEETLECCEKSPSKDDVLSYCRKRNLVDSNFMHGFESCNLDMLKNLVVPSLLSGGVWNVSGRKTCL